MDTNKIDDALLIKYMHNFFGYGNVNGDFWFVGKEEGGNLSLERNLERIHSWHNRGEKEFEDLYEYHVSINVLKRFGDKPSLQPTWSKLIRMLFSVLGKEFNNDMIREYQSKQLARHNLITCLPELLPLPSPSTNRWEYSDVSNLDYLNTRDEYREKIGNLRAYKLRKFVELHKPKLVVFYSTDKWYLDKWRIISGTDFDEENGVSFAKTPETVFGIISHPTSMGITNQYFNNAGEFFGKLINQ